MWPIKNEVNAHAPTSTQRRKGEGELGEIIKGDLLFIALTKAVDPNHSLMPFDDATQGHKKHPANQALRLLTKSEIAEYVQLYVTASRNAVERMGFDGVEIHDVKLVSSPKP